MLILKVLNGPLFGAELALPDEDCFIRLVDLGKQVVDPNVESGLNHNASVAVLTIPLSVPSPNFTLTSQVTDESNSVRAVIFDEVRGMSEQAIPLNAPTLVGGLRIAVRQAADNWSEAVLQDHSNVASDVAITPGQPARRARLGATVGAAFFCLGIAAAMSMLWPSSVPAQSGTHVLAGMPGAVMQNDNGEIYVIAQNADAAAVTRRALQRAGHDAGIRVMTLADATEKIEQLLDDAGISYFAVRLSDPQRPVLVLAAGISDETRLRLRTAIPYANDFEIQIRSQDEARSAARRLVKDIGANAEFSTAPDRFVVSISDHLSDTQLDALGRALESYRTQWGERYVSFVINQRDLIQIDGIKTGGLGYELRGNRHLFFQNQARRGGV